MSISKEKKLIEHKCIIFFNYFNIKRLPSHKDFNCWNFYLYFCIYMRTNTIMYFYVITEISLSTMWI